MRWPREDYASDSESAARRSGKGSAAKPLQARTAPSDAIGPSDSASAPTGFAAGPGPAPDAADVKGKPPERLAALAALSLGDLRLEWRRLYRAEPPRLSRDIMIRAIAYRLQEIAHGGLSKVTRRRLTTLAESFDVDGRIAAPGGPRIKSGSRLIREWHGRTHTVCVTDSGFEFEGRAYFDKITFPAPGPKSPVVRFAATRRAFALDADRPC